MIALLGVSKHYADGVFALHPTDLVVRKGEMVALFGPSGSGKTTLLNLIGGLDRVSSGTLSVGGIVLSALDDAALGEFRRVHVGFVFQFFNLVPSLTAAENVQLTAELSGVPADVEQLLAGVGLAGLGERFPAELSGGQQQRVAIARALVRRPEVLLCDEPTGALDQATGAAVLDLLQASQRRNGQTVLIVTHDPGIAARAERILHIRDGRIVGVDVRGES